MTTQACTDGRFTRINKDAGVILDRLSRRLKLSRARITAIAIQHFNDMPDETKFKVIANASAEEPARPRRTKP